MCGRVLHCLESRVHLRDHRGGGEGMAVGVVDMVDVFFMQVIRVHLPTQTCNLKPLFHGVKAQTFINTDAVPLRCA